MDDFLTALNEKNAKNAHETGQVIRPYISDPALLPLAERQELKYKYQYLEESTEALALHYRLSPKQLTTWITTNHLARVVIETDEDLQAFEVHVNNLYKSLQVRILGLSALNTAKSWQALATSEDNLLASLVNATHSISLQERPDAKIINSSAATHEKLVARHELITSSLQNADNIVTALKEQLGWEIEITHVENKPKHKVDTTTTNEDKGD